MTHEHNSIIGSGTLLALAGSLEPFRAKVHAFCGVIGDVGGAIITVCMVLWWIKKWQSEHGKTSAPNKPPPPPVRDLDLPTGKRGP